MTRYQKTFQDMLSEQKDLFSQFEQVHANYIKNPAKFSNQFNQIGFTVQDVIRDYENRLCRYSEKGQFGKYSDQLAEKFQELIRQKFPKIDDIGVEISYSDPTDKLLDDSLNSLKKISFS